MALAFHVACPITSKRICFCSLGFPHKVQSEKSKNGFLEEVSGVEELFNDLWSTRPKDSSTVQVLVPRVVPQVVVPPAAATVHVGEGVRSGEGYGVGTGGAGGGDGEELLSLHSKRTELQKRAVAASIAAEDYVRKFETGALLGNGGETVSDNVGENQGIKVMCRICFDGENEGSEKANRMLPCKLCNKRYHRSCLRTWGQNRDLFHLSSWVCPSCRTCELCRKAGDPTKFMFCRRCDGAYHCYCLQPPHKNVSSGPYLCPKHTKCHSCGSNVPGNGPSTRWFLGYTCCDACGRLFVKGNYCPVCLKVYRDSESTPMVCCDECQRWVHCQCDGISDEKYLQFQVDGNLRYNCAACRGDCYQVSNPDDAVQELWRRRDKADRDQIAILRASAGLPPEEAFSASMYSDDEVYSGDESGRSLKIPVKGSAHKGMKNTKEYGNKISNKKSGKKKGNLYSLIEKADAQQHYDGRHDRRSIEFNLTDEKDDDVGLYKNEGTNMLSSSSARSLANAKEKCSVNQAGIMKHDFVEEAVAYNEDRTPKPAHIKSNKSHGPAVGFGFGKNPSKMENVKGKKLVIHLGARNKNVNHSPKSEASGCHREPDTTAAPNGGEEQKVVTKKHSVERNDGASKSHSDVKGKPEQLKYSRNREREGNSSLIKLGKVKPEVVLPESTTTTNTRGVTLKTEEAPLKRHSESSSSLAKDPKPLLKLKFKNPYVDSRTSSSWVVPQGEEKTSIKGQRSKRKKPEKNQVREEEDEEEEDEEEEEEEVGNSNASPPVNQVMDANWILKKLGKDAIGKRVEIRQASDSSWHKGDVTNMIQGTSTIVVGLDSGGSRTLELGKQAIRFVSQKQKRSKT